MSNLVVLAFENQIGNFGNFIVLKLGDNLSDVARDHLLLGDPAVVSATLELLWLRFGLRLLGNFRLGFSTLRGVDLKKIRSVVLVKEVALQLAEVMLLQQLR